VSYEHTQSGWLIRIAMGATALGFLVMASVQPFTGTTPSAALIIGALLTAALGLLWSRLTVRVSADRLHWAFGPGWPYFSLALADIANVEVTRTTFWQGWGIHRTRRGWLYNIAGWDAVAITRNDGKQLLLGTDEPRRLKSALERALAPLHRERIRG
jgi:hypothetical protein